MIVVLPFAHRSFERKVAAAVQSNSLLFCRCTTSHNCGLCAISGMEFERTHFLCWEYEGMEMPIRLIGMADYANDLAAKP